MDQLHFELISKIKFFKKENFVIKFETTLLRADSSLLLLIHDDS